MAGSIGPNLEDEYDFDIPDIDSGSPKDRNFPEMKIGRKEILLESKIMIHAYNVAKILKL